MAENEVILEGLHPTTASCMEALQDLQALRQFRRVLDMGCGGGILSVMAAYWWDATVVAADISPQAVADTEALAAAQGMEGLIKAVRSDGFSHALIGQRAPYDLIIFNLLAEPLIHYAPEVRAHLARGGVAVLSGILRWLEPGVIQAYADVGLAPLARYEQNPWVTLAIS